LFFLPYDHVYSGQRHRRLLIVTRYMPVGAENCRTRKTTGPAEKPDVATAFQTVLSFFAASMSARIKF